MTSASAFFGYARERYQILLNRRAGLPRPWAKDPILQQYRFCNIFREDDTTTQWIREHIPYDGYQEKTLQAMVIARWFNRISTLELLLPRVGAKPAYLDNLFYTWNSDEVRRRLENVRPVVTGAYIVKTPNGMNKLEGVIWCLEQAIPHLDQLQSHLLRHKDGGPMNSPTLQWATEELIKFPFLGPFMAYEIVTDLRHTPLLEKAPDIMTWANPGPGATRGAGRVVGEGPDYYSRSNAKDQERIQGVMKSLLHMMKAEREHWPDKWPAWEMRDVEHTLCEFDKYERARLGEGRPKQRYQGAAACT